MFRGKVSSEMLFRCESKIRRIYRSDSQDKAPDAKAFHMLLEDLEEARNDTPEAALDTYFRILLLLEWNLELRLLKEKEGIKLKELAEACLHMARIQATRSQHSHLYQRLYFLLADQKAKEGQAWSSYVLRMIGDHLARDSRENFEVDILTQVQQHWALGHLKQAKIALHLAEIDLEPQGEVWWDVERRLIRVYRLSGDREMAFERLRLVREKTEDRDVLRQKQIDLEFHIASLHSEGRARELIQFLNRHANELRPFDVFMARLWLFACGSREASRDLNLSQALKQRLSKQCRTIEEHYGHALVETLELLNIADLSLAQRFDSIGVHLEQIRKAPDPEMALLFLAAAIRWLFRNKQQGFASSLISEYKSLSLSHSEGETADVLVLLHDLVEMDSWAPDVPAREQQELYSGRWPRFLKLAKLSTRLAFLISKIPAERTLANGQINPARQEILREMNRLFIECVGELRGPSMKLAQLLASSHRGGELSRKAFHELYDQVPALPFAIMKEQAERDLGRGLDEIFETIDQTPIAVASMSQVYRARLKDGTEVAVKLLYPDMDKVIVSDLKLIGLFAPVLRKFFQKGDFEKVFQQIKQRFFQEIDLNHEAEIHEEVYRSFQGDPQIVVPRIFRDYCTRTMLVSEFVHGVRTHNYLDKSSVQQRNMFGRHVFRFLLQCRLKFGLLHNDPHFGNFMVVDDQLVAFDFGGMQRLDAEEVAFSRRYVKARLDGDVNYLYDMLVERESINPHTTRSEEFRRVLAPLLLRPFDCDFHRPYLYPHELSLRNWLIEHHEYDNFLPSAKDFAQMSVSHLVEEMLASIGAEVNWRRETQEVLEDLNHPAWAALG